ncbi:MAG: DEAD/DEAH box helicase [Acidimicrobiales bacterium]
MPKTFTALGVPHDLAAHLAERGFVEPYPIQLATIEESLAGHDVCAQAPTGSGKTLAYGIPLVVRVERARPRHPRALVLAPTRELAAQIAVELALLGQTYHRRVATFYGGVRFGEQLRALQRGVDIAVACPGRLLDLLQQGAIQLGDVETVVIDEADRMADMGFMPDVRTILAKVRNEHQTLLYSATLQGDVHRLIKDHQRSPRRYVLNGSTDAKGTRSHHFWNVERNARANLTARIAAAHGSTIAFCRTKHGADRLVNQLTRSGIDAVAIHGNRSQAQRERALALFQAGKAQVLVGTDVAARGIHVDDVACVIHFDPPGDESTYIHRSGRTGRAGGHGKVISLVGADQVAETKKLQRKLRLPIGIGSPDMNLPFSFERRQPTERSKDQAQRRTRSPKTRPRARKNRSRSVSRQETNVQSTARPARSLV